MGSDTIPSRSNGQTIDQTWFNVLRSALNGNLVPRNSSGVATTLAGSIGESALRWTNAFLDKVTIGTLGGNIVLEEGSDGLVLKVGGTEVYRWTDVFRGVTTSPASAGQVLRTGSSGGFSTSSTSFTDVTNLSGSITTNGRPVALHLIFDGNAVVNPFFVGPDSTGTISEMSLNVLRDATTTVAENRYRMANIGVGITAQSYFRPEGLIAFDTPAAGTYSYKVQIKALAGSTAYVHYAKLLAYEI